MSNPDLVGDSSNVVGLDARDFHRETLATTVPIDALKRAIDILERLDRREVDVRLGVVEDQPIPSALLQLQPTDSDVAVSVAPCNLKRRDADDYLTVPEGSDA